MCMYVYIYVYIYISADPLWGSSGVWDLFWGSKTPLDPPCGGPPDFTDAVTGAPGWGGGPPPSSGQTPFSLFFCPASLLSRNPVHIALRVASEVLFSAVLTPCQSQKCGSR